MDQIEVRAYEALGWWTITIVYVLLTDEGQVTRELLYRGDHAPIDDTDAVMRAVLLLGRACTDLEVSISPIWDETDSHIVEGSTIPSASEFG